MRPAKAISGEHELILAVMLAVCVVVPLIWIAKMAITSEIWVPDFFALWSYGRFVLGHASAALYDEHVMHDYQVELGMPAARVYPFVYPPWILLLLAPFGALPYGLARGAWLVLTFAAYAVALAAWRWQRPLMGLLLLAPSSAICFLVGQNGFVTAALMLGGVRLLRTRPLAAGALLASVAYKPQLAVLLPFMLLFGRHWRAMAGAVVAVIVLSLASTLAFGLSIWSAWLACMRSQSAALTGGRDTLLDMMPTVTSTVLLLGGGALAAHLAQAAGALVGLLAVWRVKARWDPEAQAVLPLATMLATPYAFDYDLPMVTGAVLTVIAARIAAAGRFTNMEFPLLLACIIAPTILPGRFGTLSIAVTAILGLGLWAMCRDVDPHEATNGSAWRCC